MKTSIPCTCSIPPTIDLSQDNSAELLLKNLSAFGWSPIVVRQTGVQPPNHQRVSSLFSNKTSSIPTPLIYRDRESGSGASDGVVPTVEPKESLEISRYHLTVESEHDTVRQVQQWCDVLSKIAQSVTKLLELPSDTLYQSDAASSLDLMRVFFYHANPDSSKNIINGKNQSPPANALGSSPHTDWGSWTVVWQDSVGGLQTYCRACETWVSVPPSPEIAAESAAVDSTTWRCVLHVGDMASLALGIDDDTDPQKEMVQWPSPRHRVVCSNQERASLVYFAYPPTQISMTELRKRLESWKREHRGAVLPLQEYYLLQDQSASTDTSTENAPLQEKDASSWTNIPLGQCIQQKWNQVQRS